MTSTIIAPPVRHGSRQHGRRRAGADSPRPAAAGSEPRIPLPSVPLLPRRRITDLISQATERRVTLVCAPTGAGKTVACGQWATAAGPSAPNVAWLGLDPGDRRPGQLWADVRAALCGAPAIPGDFADGLPDPGEESFPLALAQAAGELAEPVILVIDDLQQLAGSEAMAGLDVLLRHGRAALRLLLSGRHAAGLQVARLRVSGELAEIGPGDLACTPEEADGYLAMLGMDLSPAERDELLDRTQGWMTGLRLAALRAAPAGQAVPGGQATAWRICGDEPVVADYLRDEVLATQPPDLRLFLMRTSLTDRISGGLADAVTAGSGSASVLRRLCRENAMITAASDGGGQAGTADDGSEYLFHPLLRGLLRAQLRREFPDEVPVLARRAARWLAAHGVAADAARTATDAGDWDLAAQVLGEAAPSLLLPGLAAEIEPVLGEFPADMYSGNTAVACALAASAVRAGDTAAAALHLDNAGRSLDRCGAGQRPILAPWLHALRLLNDAASGSLPAGALIEAGTTIARAGDAAAANAAERQSLGLLWYALGVSAMVSADYCDAIAAFQRACGSLRHGVGRGLLDRARGWQALAQAMYGGQPPSDGREGADPLPMLLADLATAHACLARDDLTPARHALDRCDAASNGLACHDDRASLGRGKAPAWAADGAEARVAGWLVVAARARLAVSQGDCTAARALLTRLRSQLGRAGGRAGPGHRSGPDGRSRPADPAGPGGPGGQAQGALTALGPVLAVLDADVALRERDTARAARALAGTARESSPLAHRGAEAGPAGEPGRTGQADRDVTGRADLRLARARVLLSAGDSQGALAAIAPLLDGMPGALTLHEQVTARVTAAIAHRRLGRAICAADHMACALALAEPGGLCRPFLDGGAAARSALTALTRPGSQGASFAARILRRFDDLASRPAGQPAATQVPLTSSELAVLRFLPSHMTNQEIAEALFLSVNTIKTHLRSVYRKLGVATRRQAITTGNRLGLL